MTNPGLIGRTKREKDDDPLPQSGRTPDRRGIPKDQDERIAIAENRSDIEDRARLLGGVRLTQQLNQSIMRHPFSLIPRGPGAITGRTMRLVVRQNEVRSSNTTAASLAVVSSDRQMMDDTRLVSTGVADHGDFDILACGTSHLHRQHLADLRALNRSCPWTALREKGFLHENTESCT
jgi:hypothetical protein